MTLVSVMPLSKRKGKEAYKKHNEIYLEKVKAIENWGECTQTLYQWLTFFRSGHIGINRTGTMPNQNQGGDFSDEDIREQFKDWETMPLDEMEFTAYLKSKKEVDIEGIWISPLYKIGIKKEGEGYVGVIIEADGVY